MYLLFYSPQLMYITCTCKCSIES